MHHYRYHASLRSLVLLRSIHNQSAKGNFIHILNSRNLSEISHVEFSTHKYLDQLCTLSTEFRPKTVVPFLEDDTLMSSASTRVKRRVVVLISSSVVPVCVAAQSVVARYKYMCWGDCVSYSDRHVIGFNSKSGTRLSSASTLALELTLLAVHS